MKQRTLGQRGSGLAADRAEWAVRRGGGATEGTGSGLHHEYLGGRAPRLLLDGFPIQGVRGGWLVNVVTMLQAVPFLGAWGRADYLGIAIDPGVWRLAEPWLPWLIVARIHGGTGRVRPRRLLLGTVWRRVIARRGNG